MTKAGFLVLHGNLFDLAIIENQRDLRRVSRFAYLSNPQDPEAFEGGAVVFDA